jgi:hypothetical protein
VGASRVVTFVVTALAALGVAAPAFADDRPELTVIPFATGVGAVADTELDLTVPKELPATAKVVVYVPGGYAANLGAAPGTKVGDVTALAIAKAAGGAQVTLEGTVVAAAPASFTTNPQAQACAPGAHTAVWVMNLTASGRTIAVPIFVDATNGSEAALGVYKLQICLASPDVPEASGGAALGAQLIEADIDFPSVFTNPAAAGGFVWRAFVTPYVAGSATPNAAGTMEVRSLAGIPGGVLLKAKVNAKKKTVTISGTLILGGEAQSGLIVTIFSSSKANLAGLKRVASVKTKAKGAFSLTRKIAKTTYFWAVVSGYFTNECATGPSVAPRGCVRETLAPAFANRAVARVTAPKKKKK